MACAKSSSTPGNNPERNQVLSSSPPSSSSSSSSSSSDSSLIGGSSSESDDDRQNQFEPEGTCHVDDAYGREVQRWTKQIPIGLRLCPWAIKAQRLGRISYVTAAGTTVDEIVDQLIGEARSLAHPRGDEVTVSALSTTLLICPHVRIWMEDFDSLNDFVRSIQQGTYYFGTKNDNQDFHLGIEALKEITLVCFHPKFLRWRGLPAGLQEGSQVHAHRGLAGFSKSSESFPAEILETSSKMFGRRKVKLRFQKDNKEQYVPVDWLVLPPENQDQQLGPILPDNAMHQAPYPTIHLIRNNDLGFLVARDVSQIKRVNARRMSRLGWEGIQTKLNSLGY